MIRSLPLTALAVLIAGVAACSDRDDDVVQAPAPGQPLAPVSETRADAATQQAALAFGMTRKQLEDANLVSPQRTDLGDVETLILDASGSVTHIVIELEGPGDREVVVPIGQLSSIVLNDADPDLTTTLTAGELAGLPVYAPTTAR
ncbi:hypothetical protein JIP62_00835 [Brevundimonas vitis]|uniref:PRC-barrel domain-containing protein n=1 Tax=Brevundimonas vitisensis TaxID=2800818 RepID=A0ABX7BMR9_9CAUL|nr:hypothetical protein [Brevundimonas vitisensis]QQQ18730.1 hypothetical protein JIP62_00835 [Brevundimonas vitisensis]